MSVFKKDDATPNNRVIPPNKRKKNAPYKYLLILGAVSLIAIASVISSVTIHIRYKRQTNRFIEAGLTEPAYSFDAAVKMANAAEASGRKAVLDDIIENFSSGTSTLSYLRNTFPDKIVFADDGRYVFTDINRSLPMHNLNRSAFAKDEAGFMTYSDSAIQTALNLLFCVQATAHTARERSRKTTHLRIMPPERSQTVCMWGHTFFHRQ